MHACRHIAVASMLPAGAQASNSVQSYSHRSRLLNGAVTASVNAVSARRRSPQLSTITKTMQETTNDANNTSWQSQRNLSTLIIEIA